MKRRMSFVANSSSSSFIVAFDRIPSSIEEMKQMLFGDKEYYLSPFHEDVTYSALEVAKIVFDDIALPLDRDLLRKEFEGSNNIEYNDPRFTSEKGETNWDKLEEYRKIEDDKEMEKFLNANKGKYIYSFEYCDEEGSLPSAMEHGDLFKNFNHVRISNH